MSTKPAPLDAVSSAVRAVAEAEHLAAELAALRAQLAAVTAAAEPLITVVMQQCGGYLSGPAFDAAEQARALRAQLEQATAARAAIDVLAERRRHTEREGWTPEHDDEHADGQLAAAAAAYARAASMQGRGFWDVEPAFWPWDSSWWKPGPPRRMLEKAGALILAEVERIDRAEARAAESAEPQSDVAAAFGGIVQTPQG